MLGPKGNQLSLQPRAITPLATTTPVLQSIWSGGSYITISILRDQVEIKMALNISFKPCGSISFGTGHTVHRYINGNRRHTGL